MYRVSADIGGTFTDIVVDDTENNNIKTISGSDAVDIAGISPLLFFLNFAIINLLYLVQPRIISEDTMLL